MSKFEPTAIFSLSYKVFIAKILSPQRICLCFDNGANILIPHLSFFSLMNTEKENFKLFLFNCEGEFFLMKVFFLMKKVILVCVDTHCCCCSQFFNMVS